MALYTIGLIYADENYAEHSYKKALKFFKQAADGEDSEMSPRAMYQIGQLYELGKGVEQDFAEAAVWYAKSDDWDAEYALGMLYLNGNGVEQDTVKAMELLESSFAPKAQLELARLYHEGVLVPKNDIMAYAWLGKCLEYEIVQFDHKLMAELNEMRAVLEAELTPAELVRAGDELDERIIKKSQLLNSLNS